MNCTYLESLRVSLCSSKAGVVVWWAAEVGSVVAVGAGLIVRCATKVGSVIAVSAGRAGFIIGGL